MVVVGGPSYAELGARRARTKLVVQGMHDDQAPQSDLKAEPTPNKVQIFQPTIKAHSIE